MPAALGTQFVDLQHCVTSGGFAISRHSPRNPTLCDVSEQQILVPYRIPTVPECLVKYRYALPLRVLPGHPDQ